MYHNTMDNSTCAEKEVQWSVSQSIVLVYRTIYTCIWCGTRESDYCSITCFSYLLKIYSIKFLRNCKKSHPFYDVPFHFIPFYFYFTHEIWSRKSRLLELLSFRNQFTVNSYENNAHWSGPHWQIEVVLLRRFEWAYYFLQLVSYSHY